MGGLLSLVTLLRAGVPSYLSRGSQMWPGVDTLICISDYCCDEYILQAPSVAWCLALSSCISLLLINQAKRKDPYYGPNLETPREATGPLAVLPQPYAGSTKTRKENEFNRMKTI